MPADALSTVTNQLLQFPETVIPSRNSDQTIVTDVAIFKGTTFGPFPGTNAVEKNYNNWMEYVTCVTDFYESNLVVAFFKKQLYFRSHRAIPAGTELLVWGGEKKAHLGDSAQWDNEKIKELTFACQVCDFNSKNMQCLIIHCNNNHLRPFMTQMPKTNCKCPFCPMVLTLKTNLRKHMLGHGINLFRAPLVTEKCGKTKKGAEKSVKRSEKSVKSSEKSVKNSEKSEQSDTNESNRAPTIELTDDIVPAFVSSVTGETHYRYKCKFCRKMFKRIKQLYGHMGSKHKINKYEYQLLANNEAESSDRGSGKKLSAWQRRRQSQKRMGIVDFKCNYCDKTFFTYQTRFRHIRAIHLGIKFICSVCKKVYYRKDCLLNHIKLKHPKNSKAFMITKEKGTIISQTSI